MGDVGQTCDCASQLLHGQKPRLGRSGSPHASLTLLPIYAKGKGKWNHFGFTATHLSAAVCPGLLKLPLPQGQGMSGALCGCMVREQ